VTLDPGDLQVQSRTGMDTLKRQAQNSLGYQPMKNKDRTTF